MLLSALAVGACAGEGFDVSIPSRIALITDTDGQQVPAGGRIPNALAVMVTAEDGTPTPRAEVAWTIVEGTGGSLSDPVTLSDGTGRAEVSLTLGPVPGMYVVRAALGADPGQAVLFSAEGTSPPQLSVVIPDRFAAGDTVALQGGGFRSVSLLEVPRVEIGGTLAQVVVVSVTGQGLSVEVTPCLAPGPVPIRVLVNSASSNLITGTYEASGAPVQLAVGQYASIDPALLAGCATFPDADAAGAEYLLVPQSVTGVPGVYGEYRLVGD